MKVKIKPNGTINNSISIRSSVAKKIEDKPEKPKREGFSVVKNPYIRSDGSLNKLAITISVLALLIALVAFLIVSGNFNKLSKVEETVLNTMASGEGQDAVATAFLRGIEKYNNGDTDYEGQRQEILKLLTEMMESDNGFTKDQVKALNQVIADYLSTIEISSDNNENEEAIKTINSLITNRKTENEENLKELKEQLESLIETNSELSNTKYDELKNLIDSIDTYLQTKNTSYDDLINQIKNSISDTKEFLRSLTNNSTGAEEYSQSKTYSKGDFVIYDNKLYLSLIDNNNESIGNSEAWMQTDIENIIKGLNKTFDEEVEALNNSLAILKIEQASDLDSVNDSLISLINSNASLSAEKRDELLNIINNNQDMSSEAMASLYDELVAAIDNESQLSEAERQRLKNQLSALKENTAADLADAKIELENSIIKLDEKYSVYYEQSFSENLNLSSGACSITFTSGSIKPYSHINIIYDDSCQEGYTVEYAQNDGSLVLTITRNSTGTAPSTLSGTIYIDNSMDNATK